MKDSLRTLLFSVILGVVCAGLLSAASEWLRPYQQANAEAERWRNVFGVLDVPFDEQAPAAELLKLVRTKDNPSGKVAQREVQVGRAKGEALTIYEYDHPAAGRLRAVEFHGPGLWGPVEGLLCLKSDLKTVFRISFYKNEETPGLGAEIDAPPFRNQFRDKTIAPAGGTPGIRVVKPDSAIGDNQVDGISGATLTCDKVEAMLKEISEKIQTHREAIGKEAGQ